MAIDFDPEDEEFQDQIDEVISALRQFLLTNDRIRYEEISPEAVIVGMEIFLNEMNNRYEDDINLQ